MLLALILAASPLVDATHDYSELNYEACVSKLSRPKALSTRDRAAGELLLGLCHFALGHEAKARAHVEAALRRDATVRTPSSASPKEQAFVDDLRVAAAEPSKVKRTARKESKPEPVVAPPADTPLIIEAPRAEVVAAEPPLVEAPREVPQVTPPLPTAVAAALPPAEKAKPRKATWLPLFTGGVALAAAGAGVGFGLSARGLETAGRAEPVQIEAARLQDQGQTHALVANVAFGVAGTAAVGTVVAWLLTR